MTYSQLKSPRMTSQKPTVTSYKNKFDNTDWHMVMPSSSSAPIYQMNQRVRFLGGCGTVKSYQPESMGWTYTVEMELEPEPAFGRVGSETLVLLYEGEIQGVLH